MKVIVFGATGKTGDHCWRKAVAASYYVTVFGRSVEGRYAHENINKVKGDVLDAQAVYQAMAGQEAVLVCLGPVGLKDRVTLSQGAANIRNAMLEHGVKRLVFVSAAGVGDSWARIPWYSKILFRTILRNILAEHTREEEIFADERLDWTAVRAAVLTEKPGTGRVLASNTSITKTIPREDLAGFLVDQLGTNDHLKQAICVTAG